MKSVKSSFHTNTFSSVNSDILCLHHVFIFMLKTPCCIVCVCFLPIGCDAIMPGNPPDQVDQDDFETHTIVT